MSATARKHAAVDPSPDGSSPVDPADLIGSAAGTEYATRGARGLRSARPHLRMVSPLRPERASRGVFALVVTAMLVLGMIGILIINTSLAQGAFTVSELQGQQATLSQQEQALAAAVAAAGAPRALERSARALGMVPSQTPVFLSLPRGRILGKASAAPGGTAAIPQLATPADATMTEAVDNASVGTDLPVAPGPGYDPAAVDAAAAQAAAANAKAVGPLPAPISDPGAAAVDRAAAAIAAAHPHRHAGSGGWSDSTLIDVTSAVSGGDAGLSAVPVN